MVVQHNMQAMNANRQLGVTTKGQKKVTEKLLDEYSKRGLLKAFYPQILCDAMETYYFNSYFMFFTKLDDIPDVYSRIRLTMYKYFPDWEKRYDDGQLPDYFKYFLKLLKKAKSAKPADLQPFKDALFEILGQQQ